MALSYYSVVQYVPDPVRDERVNIGLLVVCPELDYVGAAIDDPQRRARRLGAGRDLSFLDDLKRQFERDVSSSRAQLAVEATDSWTRERLQEMHDTWANVIQMSQPRGAITADPAQLLVTLRNRYLGSALPQMRSRGTRQVKRTVKTAFVDAGLGESLHVEYEVAGQHDTYSLDFAVVNGGPRLYVETLSLARADIEGVRSDIHATGYAFRDIRRAEVTQPIALVVAASTTNTDLVDLAKDVVEEFDARVVLEGSVHEWVDDLMPLLQDVAIPHLLDVPSTPRLHG